MQIRLAEIADLGRVMELSLAMRRESPVFSEAPYIPEVHFAWLKGLLEDEDRLLMVAEVDDTVVGFFAGGMSKYFFNDVKFAEDYTIYVDVDYRGTTVGKNLVREYEKWAKEKGAQDCYLGSNIGIQVPRFVKLLEVLGYGGPGVILSKRIG